MNFIQLLRGVVGSLDQTKVLKEGEPAVEFSADKKKIQIKDWKR